MNRASIFVWHKKLKEGRKFVRDDEMCGTIKKPIDQSSLAKGLGLLCWGFKGVREEIPSEEDSTLQIGSVAFPPGQYTSPQFHPYRRKIFLLTLFKIVTNPTDCSWSENNFVIRFSMFTNRQKYLKTEDEGWPGKSTMVSTAEMVNSADVLILADRWWHFWYR